MEADQNKVQSNIRTFIMKYYKALNLPEKYIGIQLKNIGGLSNVNFMATVKNMSNNQRICMLIFRKFGAASDCVDHNLETVIMNYLANHGKGPKSLEMNPTEGYRISEFIPNSMNIPIKDTFNPIYLSQLNKILNVYNMFSYTYKYKIDGYQITKTPMKNVEKQAKIDISKDQFTNVTEDWVKASIPVFGKFKQKFLETYSSANTEEWKDMELVDYYFKNFKDIYTKEFPNSGYLVFSHTDSHRLNFLIRKDDKKLFILDHEFACLNLPGSDICNYCNESYFNYEPDYYCTLDKTDFDGQYSKYYLPYIDEFIQNHKFIEKEKGGIEYIKKIRTKSYFIKIHNLINLWYFLWSLPFVNFDAYHKDHHSEYYFVHAVDRLKLYLIGKKAEEKAMKV